MSTVGLIVGNDPKALTAWKKLTGINPAWFLLAYGESGPQELSDNGPWMAQLSTAFRKLPGAQAGIFSVPLLRGKLEEIVAGRHDGLYRKIATELLSAYADSRYRIDIRIGWEGNGDFNANVARNAAGKWSPALWVDAYKQIVGVYRSVSPRFRFTWCPNYGNQGVDPCLLWPGPDYADIVALDAYLSGAWAKTGSGRAMVAGVHGLQWGADFAAMNGKPFALGEWGMDSDMLVPEFRYVADWLNGLGPHLIYQNWWNRPEVFDCRLERLPRMLGAFKAAFGNTA